MFRYEAAQWIPYSLQHPLEQYPYGRYMKKLIASNEKVVVMNIIT